MQFLVDHKVSWISRWTLNEVSHPRQPHLLQQHSYLRYTEHSPGSPNTPIWIRLEHFSTPTHTHLFNTPLPSTTQHLPSPLFITHFCPHTVPTAVTSQTIHTEMSSIQQLHYHQFPRKLLPFIVFTHSSSSSSTHALGYLASPVRVFTPPLRLVSTVRKQLMELSSAKTQHHLLYPLCDDSGDR